jgi:transcriptional regulator with XRE-family HTH domain
MRRQMSDYRQGVGRRLRALRQNRSLNQEDAAHLVGVSVKTWRNWERGTTGPYESNWRKIQRNFELDEEQLAAIRGDTPAPLALGEDDQADRLDRLEAQQAQILEMLGRIEAAVAARAGERTRTSDALVEVRESLDALRELGPAEVLEREADRLDEQRERTGAASARSRRRARGS